MEPQSIMCDFERALVQAAPAIWPSCTVRGCFFHYKQTLFRKFCNRGLREDLLVEGSPIREAFEHIGALSFCDPGDVVEVWEDQRTTLFTMDVEPLRICDGSPTLLKYIQTVRVICYRLRCSRIKQRHCRSETNLEHDFNTRSLLSKFASNNL